MAKEWTDGFYLSKAWRKTRTAYYRLQCGRCECCMAEYMAGIRRMEDINPGIIVHHKIELTPENINDPRIALSFDNLELQCEEHHNRQHKAKPKRYSFDSKGNIIENAKYKYFKSFLYRIFFICGRSSPPRWLKFLSSEENRGSEVKNTLQVARVMKGG